MISEVYNRFRYRQDAPFIVLVFKIVSAVLNAVRMHHLLSLFSKCSVGYPGPHALPCLSTNYVKEILLQLQIVPNSLRPQALSS